ncbi:MAG: sigma 54-interacting transcriptional regulator [Planctomycetota bacterium]|nr:sigma 54-interacting transcriptional regulator [Planctomycetota bacterium]
MVNSTILVGEHPLLQEALRQARLLASVARPVLIRGERGTGKELLARYLHESGDRRDKPFVTLNCGAFGGDLLRSELFGHEKGAFTGAAQRRIGKIEQADGGTLFLDEIGNMSAEFQEKILRIVEYQEFERVGGNETLRVNVRIIAATNADLEAMIRSGDFRADLYDRLSFAVLTMPPLRERRSDIPLLIEHFARRLAEEMPAMEWKRFSPAALEEMKRYYWPGNVRQLKNVVEHLYILAKGVGDEIMPSDLPPEITASEPEGRTFDEKLEAFQRHLLLTALRDQDGNQKAAAQALGITYDRFRHLYKKLGLKDRR